MAKTPDLFGDMVELPRAMTPGERRRMRGPPKKRGYAAPPGSGPEGETCRGCKHYVSKKYHNKTWPKCGLMERFWNHSHGSDIKASSPACKRWEKPDGSK